MKADDLSAIFTIDFSERQDMFLDSRPHLYDNWFIDKNTILYFAHLGRTVLLYGKPP